MQASLQADPAQPTAREATQSETADYAAREQQAPEALAEFQGGDGVVVIGGTTLGIILLIVLIVVLL